jgi:hypothetical protein
MSDHWIKGAIKHPGGMTRRAENQNHSMSEQIEKDTHSKNFHVRKQANLVRTLKRMSYKGD